MQPESIIRTKDFVCFPVEYANGGDLYRMVRHGGRTCLPVPVARFLFQYLVVVLESCHGQDVVLGRISPSNLLVCWDDKGMPILKTINWRPIDEMMEQVRRSVCACPVVSSNCKQW